MGRKQQAMKNKHLVYLFLLVLALGVLSRYDWPFRRFFQTRLVRLDASEVDWISVQSPTGFDLQLNNTENGWVAIQDAQNYRAADSSVLAWMQTLLDLKSIRRVAEKEAFMLDSALTVQLRARTGRIFKLKIGKSIAWNEDRACPVEIDPHVGRYWTSGDLYGMLFPKPQQFRQKGLWKWPSRAIRGLFLAMDTLKIAYTRDTSGQWLENQNVVQDSAAFAQWLKTLDELNATPFADNFDPATHPGARMAQLQVASQADTAQLDLYHVQRPELPEQWSDFPDHRPLHARYFLHSSQNPGNYFAITDTALLRRFLGGPLPLLPQWNTRKQ